MWTLPWHTQVTHQNICSRLALQLLVMCHHIIPHVVTGVAFDFILCYIMDPLGGSLVYTLDSLLLLTLYVLLICIFHQEGDLFYHSQHITRVISVQSLMCGLMIGFIKYLSIAPLLYSVSLIKTFPQFSRAFMKDFVSRFRGFECVLMVKFKSGNFMQIVAPVHFIF